MKLKKLIEIDPYKVLNSAQLSIVNKINMARAEQVNKMIMEHIPKWKIYLLKKSKLFARLFGIFTMIEPQPKLESDVLREKLILCKGSKDNPIKIAEKIFSVRDKRKINKWEIKGKIKDPPSIKNFDLSMGEGANAITFHFYVTRNIINRFRYWLFCKFFPFKVVRWDKINDIR